MTYRALAYSNIELGVKFERIIYVNVIYLHLLRCYNNFTAQWNPFFLDNMHI